MRMSSVKYVLEVSVEFASGKHELVQIWAFGPAGADEFSFKMLRRYLIVNLDERGMLFGSRLGMPRTWTETRSVFIDKPERMH